MRFFQIHHVPFLLLLIVAVTACSNPFPIGPGRVDIKLERSRVLLVDDATLFPGASQRPGIPRQRAALQLLISSNTELLRYFADWHRRGEVRCSVEGNSNERSYESFATQALLKAPAISKRYEYIVYTFIDLKAEDVQYKAGRPETTLDLRTDSFTALHCHFLGVSKAPVVFPKSNDVRVSETTFRTLVRQFGGD